MNLDKVYLFQHKQLSPILREWLSVSGHEVQLVDVRDKQFQEDTDGVVVLTGDLDVDKDDQEMIAEMENKRIPVRRIDLNGTLQASITSLNLWLKNNKCKRVVFTGADTITGNENFERFLNRLSELKL